MQALEDMTGTLNSLLRGELAATETYQQALNVLGHAPGAMDLRRIHDEHRDAANTLKSYLLRYLRELRHLPVEDLLEARYQKFRRMGVFEAGAASNGYAGGTA